LRPREDDSSFELLLAQLMNRRASWRHPRSSHFINAHPFALKRSKASNNGGWMVHHSYFILHLLYDVMVIPFPAALLRDCG
jgi:hypothetical protein